jgi:hypothetical protein
LHLVVDRLVRAEALRARFLVDGAAMQQPAAVTATAAAVAASAAAAAAASSAAARGGGSLVSRGSSNSNSGSRNEDHHPLPAVSVHVAEWCCAAGVTGAAQRAAAGASLLHEHALAELLGCEASRLVMDGVAW